jgi:probable phosphoglycerate mutase
MTTIILVRHGQTSWNREERFRGHADIPLDEIGSAQAGAVAQRIAMQWKPDAIYAGPLSRTMQTAEPAAALFALKVLAEPALIDVDCGSWQGLTSQDVRAAFPTEFNIFMNAPLDFRFPGGESLEAARIRAFQQVMNLAAQYPGQTVMMVSHTALNRLILLSILGMNSSAFWRIRQDTGAINSFEMENGISTLNLLNETGHLLALSRMEMRSSSRTV